MQSGYFKIIVAALALCVSVNAFSADADLDALRAAIEELRSDYEGRIAELERRLTVAEQNAKQARAAPQPASMGATRTAAAASGNAAFNPAIGVIFQGNAWRHGDDPDSFYIPGFPIGGEAGPISEGMSIGETEIDISANVDDKFTAWLTAPIVIEDGEPKIEVEEAWIETTAMPAGLSLRLGRFFSGIGYLNAKHQHSWDFADQPLPYQAFLGDQYLDDGLQVRWVAPTDLYMEFGTELLNGGRYPSEGSDNSGFGAQSLFVNVGGDVGTDNSWLAGVSYLDASAIDRPSGDEDDPLLFTGDSAVMTAQFVWKWAPNGNWKQKNLVIQSEYMWRREDGSYTLPGGSVLAYDTRQRGWYLQGVYQPFPRWRFGARIDGLSANSPGSAFDGTLLAVPDDDPMRYSLMTDWSNSEFSRLRFQYTRDEAGILDDNEFGLQYIFSIGAHGAHSF
ncbi:MAG: carbohydrate porin [Gammaproteobacteria bacterium]|nr:carbohydrate porin [Gammaproteobacteria bacterium]